MAHILMASPDSALLDMLESAFTGLGHITTCVTDGQLVLSTAAAVLPDMVLLDSFLPVFDGYETCALLRNEPGLPHALPILLMTSIEGDSRQLEKVGATAFISKTLPTSTLSDLLARFLPPEAL